MCIWDRQIYREIYIARERYKIVNIMLLGLLWRRPRIRGGWIRGTEVAREAGAHDSEQCTGAMWAWLIFVPEQFSTLSGEEKGKELLQFVVPFRMLLVRLVWGPRRERPLGCLPPGSERRWRWPFGLHP